ncbi:MAG TPA: cation:proton antiporter [Longimicrobiales bacterium]|nr:cation:proton antiporter [Longimicrobiales bacterium]
MHAIALLLLGAAVAYGLARALGVSPVPLLLVAGVLLAPTGLLAAEFLEDSLILGVSFLLFQTGIELNPTRTRGQRGVALRVGLTQFFALAALGLLAALALGFDLLSAGYLALALTASSTLVAIRLLQRRRQMFEPFGRVVVGVLLLQDLLVILLIPIMTRLPLGAAAVGQGVLAVAALGGLTWVSARWIAPAVLRLDGDEEPLLLSVLAFLFAFMLLGRWLGLPLVVGAFLAGVSLSDFPASGVVRSQLASIGDFFTVVFFTTLGALVAIPDPDVIFRALALTAVLILATPPLVTVIAERAGLAAKPAIEVGLLLAQTSELSLVVGLYGLAEGHIAREAFSVIAIVTLITMFLTPSLSHERVAWRLLRLHPVAARATLPPPTGGHILLLGSGSTGMPLLETILTTGHEVAVVDDDPAIVARLVELEIPCVRGEASDYAVLERVNAREARVISSTIRRPEDNRRLLDYVRGVPVIVRVFDEEDAAWILALGGTPVLYSEAAAERFFHWYDRGGAAKPASAAGSAPAWDPGRPAVAPPPTAPPPPPPAP